MSEMRKTRQFWPLCVIADICAERRVPDRGTLNNGSDSISLGGRIYTIRGFGLYEARWRGDCRS